MSKLRVGVLRGGPSGEYDVSLATGQKVLEALEDRYEVSDILISKNGEWNIGGLLTSPIRAMRRNDVFFNALHGAYGEDGTLQRYLDAHSFRYTGTGCLGSAIAMNKLLAKRRFIDAGLKTSPFISFMETPKQSSPVIEEVVTVRSEKVMMFLRSPWVIKPVFGGSSIGVVLAKNEHELRTAIRGAYLRGEKIFVEEVVFGKEATVGILEQYREKEHYALPPLQIIPSGKGGFFDYGAKYGGRSEEIPYGNFSGKTLEAIRGAGMRAHEALGLRHYSRMDCIVDHCGDIYILEVNTLPGLTRESLFPKSLSADNISFQDFLDHALDRA